MVGMARVRLTQRAGKLASPPAKKRSTPQAGGRSKPIRRQRDGRRAKARRRKAIDSRRVIRQLESALTRKGEELHELNNIGVALSAERDINKLLDQILKKSREITAADAGSLYLVEEGKDKNSPEDDRLRFKLTQNDSKMAPFEEFTMALNDTSMAGCAALTGKSVNVADAYHLPPGSPYKFSRSFDEKSGYRTKSMLVVPMRDHQDKVIGVVQLINKKSAGVKLRSVGLVDKYVIPFTAVDEELVSSLASQAAVAYENARLIQNMKKLFEAFVNASVVTIEKRDPVTQGHSRRVADLTVDLAEKVDQASSGPFGDRRFTKDEILEIRYASLLHDFGKVGVKEKYLLKKAKLYSIHFELVEQRFEYILQSLEVELLETKMRQIAAGAAREAVDETDRTYAARRAEIIQLREVVRHANKPTVLEEVGAQAIEELGRRRYRDLAGEERPYLRPDEVEALSVRKGSLTHDEREAINEHVSLTYEFLNQLPWTGELKRVAEIAWAHHEKLDGSGYPRRLRAPEIPIQPRMMTISDIFDALVAADRPYKKAVPVEKALDILRDEARGGKLDKDLLAIFIEAKIYEKTLPLAGAEVAR